MNELINVIYYLQCNDSNGLYYEILKEIDNNELTIAEAKNECITVLKQWQAENLAPYDTVGFLELQQLINSLS